MRAVNCCSGPGSFTALRVGQSVSKAICLTQDIPLLASNAFELLIRKYAESESEYIFSLIKARKDEVYYALFDKKRNIIDGPNSLSINSNQFADLIEKYDPFIIADQLFDFPISIKTQISAYSALDLIQLGLKSFENQNFENIYTFSPLYIKPPNITKPKNLQK